MLRTALIGLASATAIVFAALAGFLIQLSFEAARMAPRNETAAVTVVRHLAEDWEVRRVLAVATPDFGSRLSGSDLVAGLDRMRGAGKLVSAVDLTQTHYAKRYRAGQGLVVTATVAMTAVFEQGKAEFEIEFHDRGQGQQVSRLRITPIPLPAHPAKTMLV